MPICLKSCLKIFLACLLLSDVGCLTACQQLLSIWVSIEINVSRLRLCDGSRLTRCVSFSLRIVYLLKHKYKYKYKYKNEYKYKYGSRLTRCVSLSLCIVYLLKLMLIHCAFVEPWQCTCFPHLTPSNHLLYVLLTGDGGNKFEMGMSGFEGPPTASLQAREAVFSRGWKWWGVILSWSTGKSASVPNLLQPQSLSSLALNGAHKSSLTSVTFQAGW